MSELTSASVHLSLANGLISVHLIYYTRIYLLLHLPLPLLLLLRLLLRRRRLLRLLLLRGLIGDVSIVAARNRSSLQETGRPKNFDVKTNKQKPKGN